MKRLSLLSMMLLLMTTSTTKAGETLNLYLVGTGFCTINATHQQGMCQMFVDDSGRTWMSFFDSPKHLLFLRSRKLEGEGFDYLINNMGTPT